jgi:calpain
LELRSALHAVGYRLNYHVLNALVLRYGNRQGTLAFDDFIMCAIKMKSMIGTEIFRFFFLQLFPSYGT